MELRTEAAASFESRWKDWLMLLWGRASKRDGAADRRRAWKDWAMGFGARPSERRGVGKGSGLGISSEGLVGGLGAGASVFLY